MGDICSANLQGVALSKLRLEFLAMSFVPWQHQKDFVVIAAMNKICSQLKSYLRRNSPTLQLLQGQVEGENRQSRK